MKSPERPEWVGKLGREAVRGRQTAFMKISCSQGLLVAPTGFY